MTRPTIFPPLSSPNPIHPPNHQATRLTQSNHRSRPSINPTPITINNLLLLNTNNTRRSSSIPRKHPPSSLRSSTIKVSVLEPLHQQQHPIKHNHKLLLHHRVRRSRGLSMKCLTNLTQHHSNPTLTQIPIISCKRHQTPLTSSRSHNRIASKLAPPIKA